MLTRFAPSAGAAEAEIEPVLRPQLAGVEAPVAELLTERQERLDELLAAPGATSDELAEEFGELGKLYLTYSLAEAAESCLVNAARLAPEEFEWVYMLAAVLQNRGELAAARTHLIRALELAPTDPSARLRLARSEFELGDLDAAERLYDGLLESHGFGAPVHYGLGRIAAARGDLTAAARHFDAALADQPQAAEVAYQRARIYRQLGDLERARELLGSRGSGELTIPDPLFERLGEGAIGVEVYLSTGRQARNRGDFETAVQAFRRAIEAEPENPDHRAVLGATLLQSGRVEEAVAVYREVLTLAPDEPAPLYNLAMGLVELGEADEAKRLLRRLIELVPDHSDGRVNLATLYEQAGELVEAEATLRAAIELEPYELELRIQRASLLTSLGRASDARRELGRILEEDPDNPEALVVLGAANAALGSPGDAIAAWQRVLALEADSETQARARFFLGRQYLQQGEPGTAAVYLRQAVAGLPDNPQLRLLLAGALGAQGDFDGAAEQYEAALEAEPANENARFGKAISLLLAGREADARAHLERSLGFAPESVPLKHLLARLLATAIDPEVRDGDAALRLAQEVFDQAPSSEHAETLAMAYAEIGEFDVALSWQRRIIERARASGRSGQLRELEARGALFERREPVRAPWRDGSQP